jgi:hypothetical protein
MSCTCRASGFAQFFNKAQTPPRGTIEIIDINKLGR